MDIELKLTLNEGELRCALEEYILAHPDMTDKMRGKVTISGIQGVEPGFTTKFDLKEVTVFLSNSR